MQLDRLEGYGRRVMVEFTCRRCKSTTIRPLKECLSEVDYNDISDLRPPADWEHGGFYYPTFCPDCSEAHKKFMNMEITE